MRGTGREGSFTEDPLVRLWQWASVSIRAPLLRNMEGLSIPLREGNKSLFREIFMKNLKNM